MMKAMAQNSLVKKIKDFFILEPEDGEFADSQMMEESGEEAKIIPFGDRNHRTSVALCEPRSAEEARRASDDLRSGMVVMVNISNMEKDMAREFLDFLSGAAYAINGHYQKVGSGVFVFSPNGIPISDAKRDSVQSPDEALMFKDI